MWTEQYIFHGLTSVNNLVLQQIAASDLECMEFMDIGKISVKSSPYAEYEKNTLSSPINRWDLDNFKNTIKKNVHMLWLNHLDWKKRLRIICTVSE
jgi:hypothetical protein